MAMLIKRYVLNGLRLDSNLFKRCVPTTIAFTKHLLGIYLYAMVRLTLDYLPTSNNCMRLSVAFNLTLVLARNPIPCIIRAHCMRCSVLKSTRKRSSSKDLVGIYLGQSAFIATLSKYQQVALIN